MTVLVTVRPVGDRLQVVLSGGVMQGLEDASLSVPGVAFRYRSSSSSAANRTFRATFISPQGSVMLSLPTDESESNKIQLLYL